MYLFMYEVQKNNNDCMTYVYDQFTKAVGASLTGEQKLVIHLLVVPFRRLFERRFHGGQEVRQKCARPF